MNGFKQAIPCFMMNLKEMCWLKCFKESHVWHLKTKILVFTHKNQDQCGIIQQIRNESNCTLCFRPGWDWSRGSYRKRRQTGCLASCSLNCPGPRRPIIGWWVSDRLPFNRWKIWVVLELHEMYTACYLWYHDVVMLFTRGSSKPSHDPKLTAHKQNDTIQILCFVDAQ